MEEIHKKVLGGQKKQSGRMPWRAASLCAERKALLRLDRKCA